MLAFAIAVVLALVVLNGLFAMTELAVVSSRKSKLQARAERGDKGARAALKLAEEPTHFLSAVQVGITLIGIAAGAYGQAAIAGELNLILEGAFPALAAYTEIFSTVLVIVFITYVSVIVGELVPKRLALIFPETIASRMAAPISTVAIVLKPFVLILTASTSAILKLMNVRDRDGSDVTQEEVETMIAEGTASGLIEPEEQTMIEEILRLGDRPIRVAMTPRHEVFWIALDDSDDILRKEIRTCPYSRIVVARENDVDNPLGVIHKKDLLDSLLDNGEFNVEKHIQTPAFIPQSTSVLKALEIMKASKVHMAFLVDEFGAFEGVARISARRTVFTPSPGLCCTSCRGFRMRGKSCNWAGSRSRSSTWTTAASTNFCSSRWSSARTRPGPWPNSTRTSDLYHWRLKVIAETDQPIHTSPYGQACSRGHVHPGAFERCAGAGI